MPASLSHYYNNQSFEPGKIASAFRKVLSSFGLDDSKTRVDARYNILDEGYESRPISWDELGSVCELKESPTSLNAGFGDPLHFFSLTRVGNFLSLSVNAPTAESANKPRNGIVEELALIIAYPKIVLGDDLENPEANGGDIDNYETEIKVSLQKFQQDHNHHKTTFIMMQFGASSAHKEIVTSIKDLLSHHNIEALRADDKEYHNNLLRNVLTYIYGCDIGVAVFDRIEGDAYNPNVAFEIGYMKALNKPVCLLVDQDMKLPTDLLGELYKPFAPQDPTNSIPGVLEKWLHDKDIINN